MRYGRHDTTMEAQTQIIELNKLKVNQLKYIAKKHRIKRWYNMLKPILIEVLRDKGVEIKSDELGELRCTLKN